MSDLNISQFSKLLSKIGGYTTPALSIIAMLISLYSVRENAASSERLQVKQQQGEVIKGFDVSSNQIVDAGGKFLTALSEEKDLSDSKITVSNFAGRQVLELETVARTFKSDISIIDYRNAVSDFNKTAQSVKSAKDMKILVESFGKAVDARNNLLDNLHYRTGNKLKS
jgi:transcriptional regulator with PAS, ATPase and Fis domain